jgi:hypothetical protein
MALSETKAEVAKLLGREPTIKELPNKEGFVVEYIAPGTPIRTLVGKTEEDAYQKILDFLKDKKLKPAQ